MAHLIDKISANRLSLPQGLLGEDALSQVWDGGTLTHRSANAPSTLLSPLDDGFHILNHAGLQWRIYVYRIESSNRWIIYGSRYDLFRSLIDTLILESILPIIWALPILGLLVWLIVSYGLRPLRSFAKMLTQRGVNDLRAIEDDQFPTELSDVVTSTNRLFGRLSEAFEREQRFAADAAHELRTPLAALKVNLHNLSQNNHLTGDSLSELEASARRMENLIEQILALYRLSPENFQSTLVTCDLKSIIQQVIIDLYDSLHSKQHNIELLGESMELEADTFALSLMIKNLIDNAVKYTPENGRILLSLCSDSDSRLTLSIEDSGPGISELDHDRIFERFYRVGRDRHSSGVTGSGLGLSIVQHVIKLHHGAIALSKSDALGGLSISVTLPKKQTNERA